MIPINRLTYTAAHKPPIEAVIFDLDGTLLDTETLSSEAIQAVVSPYGKTFTWYVSIPLLEYLLSNCSHNVHRYWYI